MKFECYKTMIKFQISTKYLISLFFILLILSLTTVKAQREIGKSNPIINIPDLKTCQNLLRNGDFEKGLTGWKVVNFTNGATTEAINQNKNTFIRFHHNGQRDWNSIGQEIRSMLEIGKTYVVSLKYKVESNLSLGVRFGDSSLVMHSSSINEKYGWDRLMIGNENWREDTFEFTAKEDSPKSTEPMFAIYLDYYNTGEILIDDVIFAAKTSTCRAK